MNFLSHYYLHNDENDNYFTVGLTIPDLLGFHSKRIRITKSYIKNIAETENNEKMKSVIAGMYLHLELDRFFHNSSFFKEMQEFIQSFFYSRCSKNLPQFYAHILGEILIDRHLLEINPMLADEFYSSYKKFSFKEITKLFEGFKNFSSLKFIMLAESVAHSSFLNDYINDDAIISIFERISRRIGMPLLIKLEKKAFSDFIASAYIELQPAIKNFMIFAKKAFDITREDVVNSQYSLILEN